MSRDDELLKLAAACESAGGPSRILDANIEGAITGAHQVRIVTAPAYTASLDIALTLYKSRPSSIPTDPLKACAEALRQWR